MVLCLIFHPVTRALLPLRRPGSQKQKVCCAWPQLGEDENNLNPFPVKALGESLSHTDMDLTFKVMLSVQV